MLASSSPPSSRSRKSGIRRVVLSQRRERVLRVVADERGPRAHLDERRLDREERLPQIPELLLGLVDEAARRRRRPREERRGPAGASSTASAGAGAAAAPLVDAACSAASESRTRPSEPFRRPLLVLESRFFIWFHVLFFQLIGVCRT